MNIRVYAIAAGLLACYFCAAVGNNNLYRAAAFSKNDETIISRHNSEVITISRGTSRLDVRCRLGYRWGDRHLIGRNGMVYILRNKIGSLGGYSPDAIVELELNHNMPVARVWKREDIDFSGEGDPIVTELFAISDDGKRLLVLAAFTESNEKAPNVTSTSYYPCILDLKRSKLERVVP